MADGSPVGSFIESGDDQKLGNCTPPEVLIRELVDSLCIM